jgi:hypothetical protein
MTNAASGGQSMTYTLGHIVDVDMPSTLSARDQGSHSTTARPKMTPQAPWNPFSLCYLKGPVVVAYVI